MIACVYRSTRSRHWKTQSKTGLALRLAPTDGGRLHYACPFIASAGATAIYHALGMATYPWATAPVHVVYEYECEVYSYSLFRKRATRCAGRISTYGTSLRSSPLATCMRGKHKPALVPPAYPQSQR